MYIRMNNNYHDLSSIENKPAILSPFTSTSHEEDRKVEALERFFNGVTLDIAYLDNVVARMEKETSSQK